MSEKYLYVVFSSTPYKIGRAIRQITREEYNHVSISLQEDLVPMYGFARRYCRTPLYGGFVEESISRYHLNGVSSRIRVCRLPLTEQQYEKLTTRIAEMSANPQAYLYNHFSALTAPFHKSVKLRDAYICVEFVVDVLKSLGYPLDPKRYYTVGRLEMELQQYTVYTGVMPEAKEYDHIFFADKPVDHPFQVCCGAFFRLIGRFGAY